MNGLDLFSGIGGLTLALSPWVYPIAYCEIEKYAQAVILSRQVEGALPIAPIFDDIRSLTRDDLNPNEIDIIYGGFPCQDVSSAGLRKGLDGERTGLFREAIRLVRECKPQFVFFENVPGIRKYVPSVRGELEAIGYDCRDGFLSASEVGAPHVRNRWWILAHTNSERRGDQSEQKQRRAHQTKPFDVMEKSVSSDSEILRFRAWDRKSGDQAGLSTACDLPVFSNGHWADWAETRSAIRRENNGLPFRVDRLKGLGNSVVPQCAREAFKILMGIK